MSTDVTTKDDLAIYCYTIYKVQALLAVDPKHPRWSGIYAWAVKGYKELPETPHRMKGYRFGQFWNDCLGWDDEAVAKEQFALLMRHEQKNKLRLIRVKSAYSEELVK